MDDITFVRSHWWLVSEGFSTIDRQLRCTETPRHSVPSYCRFPRLCRLKCVKSSLKDHRRDRLRQQRQNLLRRPEALEVAALL